MEIKKLLDMSIPYVDECIRSLLRDSRDRIAELEATIRENTAEVALIINPGCIEQPSHEDLILWLSAYRDEFIDKSKMIDLLLEDPWISIKDRIPDHADEVMVSYNNGIAFAKYWETTGMWLSNNSNVNNGDLVTHWQPIPSPPKEQE